MFGWIGRVFGTQSSINKVIDTAANGLDKLHYGDQEKAQDHYKAVTEARAAIIKWIGDSTGQNLARRILAFGIGFTWLAQYWAGMVLDTSAVWVDDPKVAERMLASAVVIGERADGMTGAMMLILGFYFAAPHLDKFIVPAMDRFSKTKV